MTTKVRKSVSDLGIGAYVKMHGFKCVGRRNRNFFFEMDEKDTNQFDQLAYDYGNSPFHDFDAELMALKKMPEFLPE